MGTGEEDDMVGGFLLGVLLELWLLVFGGLRSSSVEGEMRLTGWLAGWLASLIGLQSPCEAKELAS